MMQNWLITGTKYETDNQNELFKIVESLLHNKGKPKLPTNNSKDELSQKFSDFFRSKICNIRNGLDIINSIHVSTDIEEPDPEPLEAHTPATDE